jgi:aldehyde:ferredoxin oxidoreductase
VKFLDVDLSKRRVVAKDVSENVRKNYIGGWGFGAKILWDELKPGVDPLGPENILVVSTGPFTGTGVTGSGSVFYEYKSPLTGIWGENRSGGEFGTTLRRAGFDAIVIRGKADKPVYLLVNNGEAEIKDAEELWGKTTHETTDILAKEKGMSVACIGPAGENKVRFAAIMNDRDRAAGRCGGGAVMGAKNLKAIVATGNKKAEIAEPEKLKDSISKLREGMKNWPFNPSVGSHGTISLVSLLNGLGCLPTKNFKTTYFEDAAKISAEALEGKYLLKSTACHGCVVGCGRYSEVKAGKYQTPPGEGPEYETTDMLGADCMVSNLEAVIQANHLANSFGLDTISTGSVIAFAMEAFEKGYLTTKDTGGLEIKWGHADVLLELISLIAKQEGIGKLLAQGVRAAAKELTKRNPTLPPAEDFAVHVKGLEVPAHDPRAESKNLAIQYAITPRGACHMHPTWPAAWDFVPLDNGLKDYGLPPSPADRLAEVGIKRGEAYRLLALHGELTGALGMCIFYNWGLEEQGSCLTPALVAELYSSITGDKVSGAALLKIAERVWNLKRCFNVREGISRKDDKLPKRLLEPVETGPSAGKTVDNLEGMLDEVYDAFGWDKKTGKPKREKLEELGLGGVIDQL